MDPPPTINSDKPTSKYNLLDWVTFRWVTPLIELWSRPDYQYDIDDLYKPEPYVTVAHAYPPLNRAWQEEVKSLCPSIARAMVKAFWWNYLKCAVLIWTEQCFYFLQPIIFGHLISYFSTSSDITLLSALWYCLLLLLASFGTMMTDNMATIYLMNDGMRWKAALSKLVYTKALKMKKSAMRNITVGEVVDLVSVDCERMGAAVWVPARFFTSSLLLVASFVYLYTLIGVTMVPGMATVLVSLLITMGFGKIHMEAKKQYLKWTDRRMGIMGEIVSGMKTIKMLCWQESFVKKLQRLRKFELRYLYQHKSWLTLMSEVNYFQHRLFMIAVLVTFTLMGTHVGTSDLLCLMMAVEYVGHLMGSLCWHYRSYTSYTVSAKRVQHFLLLPEDTEDSSGMQQHHQQNGLSNDGLQQNSSTSGSECKKNPSEASDITCSLEQPVLQMSDVCASWDGVHEVLHNITFDLRKQSLTFVLGAVGAGKSSLLYAAMQEMKITSGKMSFASAAIRLSYCTQQPWVFPASVRINIIMGLPYDEQRYQQVLRNTCLAKDIAGFSKRDETVVGDRGVNLSGGQKSRLSLARALYRSADVYVLDDPLSAVDHHVGKEIFYRCILDLKAQGKTVLLATHDQKYLPYADQILMLNEGELTAYAFEEYKRLFLVDHHQSSHVATIQVNGVRDLESNEDIEETSFEKEKNNKPPQSESNDIEAADWTIYFRFLSSGSGPVMASMFVVVSVVAQWLHNYTDRWLAAWNKSAHQHTFLAASPVDSVSHHTQHVPVYSSEYYATTTADAEGQCPAQDTTADMSRVTWYLVISALFFIFSLGRFVVNVLLSMRSAQKLHGTMLKSVMGTTIKFYDTNYKGKILGRFSGIQQADCEVAMSMSDFIKTVLVLCGSLLVSLQVLPWLVLVMPPLAWCTLHYRQMYSAGRKRHRMSGRIHHNQLATHLTATVEGVDTIRGLDQSQAVIRQYGALWDVYNCTRYTGTGLHCWFYVRTGALVAVYTALCLLSSVVAVHFLHLEAVDISLVVLYCIPMVRLLQHGSKSTISLEDQLCALSRLHNYTSLAPEGIPKIQKETKQANSPLAASLHLKSTGKNGMRMQNGVNEKCSLWCGEGSVQFHNVYLSYNDDDNFALKDVCFTVGARKTVGIIGRTGSGKSSLVQALFRLTELTSGCITIDGVDISDLDLMTLRSSISVIPQDPTLFSGTVRDNLDPTHTLPADALWDVLKKTNLKKRFENQHCGLETEVLEGGGNYSVGEKQLLCLARAMLTRNTILVLDEATANVDMHTDSLIQHTLHHHFSHCTKLIIAHRLNTVMHADHIIVMESGRVIKQGAPHDLIS